MTKDDLIMLMGMLFFDTLWAVSLWRHWPEQVYEQKKDSSFTWYWLEVFGIPKTRGNCVRLLRSCNVVGMTIVTGSTLFFLVLRHWPRR